MNIKTSDYAAMYIDYMASFEWILFDIIYSAREEAHVILAL